METQNDLLVTVDLTAPLGGRNRKITLKPPSVRATHFEPTDTATRVWTVDDTPADETINFSNYIRGNIDEATIAWNRIACISQRTPVATGATPLAKREWLLRAEDEDEALQLPCKRALLTGDGRDTLAPIEVIGLTE